MEIELDKDVFTTFEVAEICNANITSIKNWIDKGELRAFRTPGGHYRIEQKVLNDFLNRHEMPNPFAERERRRVLVVHEQPELVEVLAEELGQAHEYDATDDAVDAVLKIGQWKPDAAVVDADIEELDVAGLCSRVREHADLSLVTLIVVHRSEVVTEGDLRQAGADYTVTKESGKRQVVEAVRRALL